MNSIPSIFFLQLAGLLACCVPQAELTYWSAQPADDDSDRAHGLIRLADSVQQSQYGFEDLIVVIGRFCTEVRDFGLLI